MMGMKGEELSARQSYQFLLQGKDTSCTNPISSIPLLLGQVR